MLYQSLRQGVKSKSKFFPVGTDYNVDRSKDWYTSLYYYNEEHKKILEETGTIKGIADTKTNRLFFDFDIKKEGDSLEKPRKDALTLIHRLIEEHHITEEQFEICFSGRKGFTVELQLEDFISPEQFKAATFKLAGDLETFDKVVNDANRIVRLRNTKHAESGLYKIVLAAWELDELNIVDIFKMAEAPRPLPNKLHPCKFKDSLFEVKKNEVLPLVDKKFDVKDIDFVHKVKGWPNCKWALVNGYQIKPNERHDKLLCIIAHAKSLNNTKEQAYQLAKEADRYGNKIYGGERVVKEQLWTMVESVYDTGWKGGTYSCKDGKHPWLTEICNSLGSYKCQAMHLDVVSTSEVFNLFEDYAHNFENNVIKTGIPKLDELAKFMVGTSNAVLGSPGIGKTSWTLNMLNYNSKQGIDSVFYSYDMYHSMVILRLIQKHFKMSQEKIFDIFKHDKKRANEIKALLEEEYKHVHFCFKSGQTADEIQETILNTEQRIGRKIKLGMVDYSELVISSLSDSTQASAQTAQRLRQIANDTSTCMITLLQPSKMYSTPADEVTSYTAAKGSGAIAQAVSLMLSLSRPGYSPRNPEQDKFLTVNALKNRMGALFTIDLAWEGSSAGIRELTYEEEQELAQLRERKAQQASQESSF